MKNSIFVNYFKIMFKNYYKIGDWYLLGIDRKIINSNVLEQNFINLIKLIKMAENLINSDKKKNIINNQRLINSDETINIRRKLSNIIKDIKSFKKKKLKQTKEKIFEIKKTKKRKRNNAKKMEPVTKYLDNG